MTTDAFYSKIRSRLMPLVKDVIQRAEQRLAVYIERFLDEQGPGEDGFSSSNRIGAQKGGLSRALIPGQPGHLSRFKSTDRSAEVTTGIDETVIRYAHVHEKGMRITATSKMIAFFWAKYLSTRAEKWLATVLSAKKKGYVEIKAKPFYRPGFEAFQNQEWPRLMNDLQARLRTAANG